MEGSLKEIFAAGPKFEENILKAFENRKLVFFLGAGVSRIMGIMGWDDFSAFLIRKAFPDYKDHSAILRDISSSKERITIAYKKFEQDNRLDEFYKHFGQGMTPKSDVFQSKENIYKILNRFEALFLTTNADNLFEEVLGSALCHEDYSLTILKRETQRRQNHLFYLHGHYTENIDKLKNNLVFTAPQYVERYNDQNFIGFLRAIFEEDNTIVFIGYGLNEFELIDYIVTKAVRTLSSTKNVYVLYPFCENDDLLYEVKKSYFEALNIEVIPYNISKNGYDSLIDVLNALYDDYQKRTVVPITETISECILNFNDANYAVIKRYLSDSSLAPTTEVQITREIQRTGNNTWVECFFKDGLYSQTQMDIKIAYGSWPVLELFVDWVRSDYAYAQNAACTFLDQITPEQIEELSKKNSFINKDFVQMIIALDRNHIQDKYLDMMMRIGHFSSLFDWGSDNIFTLHRLISWDWTHFQKILDWLFDGVDIDSFGDEKTYIIEQFFKQINLLSLNDCFSLNVFNYFKNMIVSSTPPDKYNLFTHIFDVDHIYKNNEAYWKIVLTELSHVFCCLTMETQKIEIHRAISSSNVPEKKIGIYLARKYNHNVSELIVNSDLFSHYSLYHECYLLMEQQMENEYLNFEVQDRLSDIISTSSFEIDTYKQNDLDDDAYYNKLILSKRLAMLMLLSSEKSKDTSVKLRKIVEPYETKTMAQNCDYVHISNWENSIVINKDVFNGIPYENWVEKLREMCSQTEDEFSVSDCGVKFAQLLLELSDEKLNIVLPTLKILSPSLLNSILHKINVDKDILSSNTILLDTYLDILDGLYKTGVVDNELLKTIFAFLATVEFQDGAVISKVLDIIQPWLYISIDGVPAFNRDEHVLSNLINFGDFEKFSALLHCYVVRKSVSGSELSDQERDQLLDLLDHDNENKTFRYTLCYYYSNLKYLSSNKAIEILEVIFRNEPFDMTALIFSTLNTRYLYKEVTEKIEMTYLSSSTAIPDECKERVLTDHFYGYIVAARYENEISSETFEKAYRDCDFLKYFLHSLRMWTEKANFDAEKWLVPCWNFIKAHYLSEEHHELLYLMLQSADDINVHTDALLDMYIDIVPHCSQKQYMHIKIPKLLPFFEIDKIKTHTLYREILAKQGYIDKKALEEVLSKYGESNLSREGRELLNMLTVNGKISNHEKEQFAKLL